MTAGKNQKQRNQDQVNETQSASTSFDNRPLSPARQKLVDDNIGLVGLHLRSRVPCPWNPNRRREYQDLFQEGCLALIHAARKYDPQTDGRFAAFALPRIRRAVHVALHDHFSLIHLPARVQKKTRQLDDPSLKHLRVRVQDWPEELQLADPREPLRDDCLAHHLNRRFRRAVRRALEELKNRKWSRRNPVPIMQRLAVERLLITSEKARTPLRSIARDTGISSGRISAYERRLREAVDHYFRNDPQVAEIHALARRDPAGLETPLDDEIRYRLQQAELRAFENRFHTMDRAEQARTVYEMIERSTTELTEVVRNLYRLTMDEPELSAA
jgi:RNA polymerase sigma factor (sigma-70 family)